MFFVFFKKKKKNTIPFESNQNCYKNSNDCGIQNSDVLKKKKIRHVLHCKFYVSVSLTSGRKMYWHLNLKDE